MSKIRFEKVLALSVLATLLIECSGGLPEDYEGFAGADSVSAGQGNGGTLTTSGSAHGAGRDSIGTSGAALEPAQAGAAGTAGAPEAGAAGEGGTAGNSGAAVSGGTVGTGGTAGTGNAIGGGGTAGTGATGGRAGAGGTAGTGAAGGRAGANGTAGSAGKAGSCGLRQCDSDLDNDCSGKPDNEDPSCACSSQNAVRDCATGSLGVCAAGTQKCTFSQDKTQSSWSTCTGQLPGTRDCGSNSDKNCNGTPDNVESACTACVVGARQACNTHPEDNKGLCKAGSKLCEHAPDYSSVLFGSCSGDVAPTSEVCGPFQSDGVTLTPDANCNQLNGDGDYLTMDQKCTVDASIPGATVHLFKASQPGTVAVHKCKIPSIAACDNPSYVALSCDNTNLTDEIMGYAPTTQPGNYRSVTVSAFNWSCNVYASEFLTIQRPAFTVYVLP